MSTSETNQRKLSVVETRNLLRHATAISSTKEVASFVGVPDSRISEGKSGKWQLSHEQATRIRSEYGEPRAAAGQYLEGELWPSVSEIINSHTLVSRWIQWHRINSILTKKQFSEYVGKILSTNKIGDEISSIIRLIETNEFQRWFEKNKDARIKEAIYDYYNIYENEYLCKIAWKNNVNFQDEKELGFLILSLLLGSLKAKQKELEIEFECDLTTIPILQADNNQQKWPESIVSAAKKREMVLLGDIVWDHIFKINLQVQECVLGLGVPYNETPAGVEGQLLNCISQDQYQWAAIRIILTADLNYHMVINLESSERMKCDQANHNLQNLISLNYGAGSDGPKRLMVIRDVQVESLFQWLSDIYKWLGAERPSIVNLKEKIAILGGYIPGATYIE